MLPAAMEETLNDVERDRDKEDGNEACGQHPAEDSEAQQNSSMRAGACGHDQRKHAENEGERRHQDGAKS